MGFGFAHPMIHCRCGSIRIDLIICADAVHSNCFMLLRTIIYPYIARTHYGRIGYHHRQADSCGEVAALRRFLAAFPR